jgi:hypothetical protein
LKKAPASARDIAGASAEIRSRPILLAASTSILARAVRKLTRSASACSRIVAYAVRFGRFHLMQ